MGALEEKVLAGRQGFGTSAARLWDGGNGWGKGLLADWIPVTEPWAGTQ